MLLSPEDVVRKTFNTVVLRRGYDADEVDAFLEEVVLELRRLHGKVDELQAQVNTLGAEVSAEGVSPRMQLEQQQLEQVRAERRDLVADMAALQERYDSLRAEVSELEDRTVS
ncbi:DivIVA domain-containing protein [Ornithinimicrobium flavum]|uniref:DivIVA domain-containing protein n=1 Tax=Ornithinimicrobium flavum TaxID=1288636 RepID=UPI00106F8341|nr:DivIVA domain-containing protein [Ornithinimicrobium flavum]